MATETPWTSSNTAEKTSTDSMLWRHVEVFFNRLKDRVRVELDVAHDRGEHVPFDLRKGKEEVLVGEQRVLAPPRLLDGTVDNPLRGFSNLARRDVEIFYVHCCLRPLR
jgi:hypothetical protein